MFKNALISVTDKTGLVEFIKPLVASGLRVVSTGGTAEHLRNAGVPVIEVRDQTGFPEVMDGRVRTLHPHIHMALLGRSWVTSDMALLKEHGLEPFDLVIGNLYPFHKYRGQGLSDRELVEHIDIGGPALLRAAAKNFDRITVICDPSDYGWIAKTQMAPQLAERKRLAAKLFSHISSYDAMVAGELNRSPAHTEPETSLHLVGDVVQSLRYGENPHQKAIWYKTPTDTAGLHSAEILQGKELSFNNILDLDAATATVREFCLPTVVIVKHNNPCGVATANSIAEATQRAISSDPVSAFGGIVALNRALDLESAQHLSALFLECVIAPEVSEEARDIFSKKQNVRVLEWRGLLKRPSTMDLRSISGGYLAQDHDSLIDWKDAWQVHGAGLTQSIKTDLIFAYRVCAHLKSNAIALASGQQTLGLGMGQVNRIDAVEHAITRMRQHFSNPEKTSENIVLASDAFFPFPDSIDAANRAGVRWIIQPGGAKKDLDVLTRAKELGIHMVMTGERHFRH